MKKIEAIITPFTLDALQEALRHVGLKGMTVSEVRAENHRNGRKRLYRGTEYVVDLLPKIKVEFVVSDDKVATCADVIEQTAKTAGLDDADIVVSTIDEVIRIRTGEHGASAL
jgi:nitrogen regulatory protein PII